MGTVDQSLQKICDGLEADHVKNFIVDDATVWLDRGASAMRLNGVTVGDLRRVAQHECASEVIDLAHRNQEIRFVITSDPGPLRSALEDFCLPDDVNRIIHALAADPGVNASEFMLLLVNAGVSKASLSARTQLSYIACNIEPGCNSGLGHDGECDTEVPF